MNHKERNYLKALQQLQQGQLTRVQAAEFMGCSERHVSRLRQAYRTQRYAISPPTATAVSGSNRRYSPW